MIFDVSYAHSLDWRNGFFGGSRGRAKERRACLAVFHRGTTAAPSGVTRCRGDRHQLNASAQELKRFAPDVVMT